MTRERSGEESGQVTVLVIGLTMVTFAVSGLAVDGTRAFLARRALQNLADAAALAAADQVDADAFYSGGGREISVDPDAARAAASDLLGRAGGGSEGNVSIHGSTVGVRLIARVETSFLLLLGVSSIPVSATAQAEPEVGSVPDEGPEPP